MLSVILLPAIWIYSLGCSCQFPDSGRTCNPTVTAAAPVHRVRRAIPNISHTAASVGHFVPNTDDYGRTKNKQPQYRTIGTP